MEIFNTLINKIKNNKELFLNIIGSVGIKGLSIIINVLTLPAYLHYFGDQKILGLWFAILSVLNWVLTFDLGIGNGLRNYLVEALFDKDEKKAKMFISSAYISIGCVALFLGILGYIIIDNSNWNSIFNISENIIGNNVLVWVIQLIYIGIILQLFLRLILSILYALQKTAISNFISLLSNSLILLFLVTYNNNDVIISLQIIAVVYFLAINIPLIIASLVVFAGTLKESRPSLSYFHIGYSKKILNLGLMFLGIQLSLLVINSTNEILIIRLFEPEDVVIYQAYFKIFSIFLILISLITIPIWSAVTKAYKEKRIDWIKKIYRYLNISALVISIFCFATVFIFQEIVNIWLGKNAFEVDMFSVSIFALYNMVMLFALSSACIANGTGKLKLQMTTFLFAAIIKIPLVILLSSTIQNWIIVMIINIIIMIPYIVLQPIVIFRDLRVQIDNISSKIIEKKISI